MQIFFNILQIGMQQILYLLIFPENSSANQTWQTMKNDFRNLWLGYAVFHRSRLLLDIDLYLQENLTVLTKALQIITSVKENLRNTYLMRCTAPFVVFSFLDIIIPYFSVNVNTFFKFFLKKFFQVFSEWRVLSFKFWV